MNHSQINKLTPNTVFEVKEDYAYCSELWDEIIIKKGTKTRYLHPALERWYFEFQTPQGVLGYKIGFGRSRLLKFKLKECSEFKEDSDESLS